MQQAWEYEKEGMGLQYNYGQQAADAEYRRNLQMWKDTNFGAQRREMEDAGLSVGLMYGNGGGSAASTAGGTATQPSGPKMNPVEAALQQESMGLQLKQIEAQNRLANAETDEVIITIGNHLATEQVFKSEEEAQKVIDETDWNLVAALIYACKEADQWKEKQKETLKKEEE